MPSAAPAPAIVNRIGSPQPGETDESLRKFLAGHTAKELRSVCKHFSVKVRSKKGNMDNKIGYVTILVRLARSRRESEEAAHDQRNKLLQGTDEQLATSLSSTRKTKHCSFRLVNVLFSERFCDRLGQMGSQPTRRELDTGAVGGHNGFWQEVAAEFAEERAEYAGLVSRDERFSCIDPGHVVPHDSNKLKQIWKDTSAQYAAAHARATQSGAHESDFYDFCMGHLDALYVSAWLVVRPQAFGAAVGSMPKHCQLDTLDALESSDETSSSKISTPNVSKKRSSDAETVIAFLESRFGSASEKTQQKERAMHDKKRMRTFTELEKLTKSLCAAVQAGLSSAIVGRLEAKVDEYVKRVEDIHDSD
ncbi:Hypothetical protein PHPALM_7304 [Phytophthora palmivora]|uniref:Uncharacterized protein n=1 Tax=Phytophthora palmivora TaxID=4796 RepID=A0A2P4YD10_9STRA|nr:Hypothetical protein PHPALM_7304 [Phytophthora palmivora]